MQQIDLNNFPSMKRQTSISLAKVCEPVTGVNLCGKALAQPRTKKSPSESTDRVVTLMTNEAAPPNLESISRAAKFQFYNFSEAVPLERTPYGGGGLSRLSPPEASWSDFDRPGQGSPVRRGRNYNK